MCLKNRRLVLTKIFLCLLTVTTLGPSGCTPAKSNLGADPGEDASASGVVAVAIGGALNQSIPSGTVTRLDRHLFLFPFLIPAALASFSCPTLATATNNGTNSCTSAGNIDILEYDNCHFGVSGANWSGFLAVTFQMGTTLTCGTFPTPTNDTLLVQFVQLNNGASIGTRTSSASGTVVLIDHTLSGIYGNYQSDTFNGSGASGFSFSPINSGGGKGVAFDSNGLRTAATSIEHLAGVTQGGTLLWDYTMAGTVPLTETDGSAFSTTWTANTGTVTNGTCTGGMAVYNNTAQVMGTACFQNVVYSPACCAPISGTITTSFSTTSQSGSNPIGQAMNGKSETLTFKECGNSATLVDYTGNGYPVMMTTCY